MKTTSMISIAYPLLGAEEHEAVLRVLASGQLAQGEQVAAFEKRFAATANVMLLVGATPVFVDIDPETYNIDPTLVETAFTPKTKAILPVHLYGNPCDMYRLEAIATAHDLVIIEDACQAHAANIDSKPVGGFGTGCFSFYATKNMTTGEGGMVTTNDPLIAERVRLLRSPGQKERYHHTMLGYNQRMTEIQAAIGLVQIEKLERFTEQRIANARFLTERLSEVVQTPVVRPGYRHVYHQYTIRLPRNQNRVEWVEILPAHGIGIGIHYPVAIHQQPFYQEHVEKFRCLKSSKQKDHERELPIAEIAAKQVLSLPVHPALSEDDLATVVREVRALCD